MSFAVRPIGLASASNFIWRPTISADVTNYNLRSAAIAAGWDGVAVLDAIVTVASGIVLSANSTSTYGFDTGSGFPAGSTLGLVLGGYVCGMGGAGDSGSSGGSAGGPALRAQYAITIDASGGVIAGGGGGGGGYGGGGGGGRSGRTSSAGGGGGAAAGTFSSGGKGGGTYAGNGGTTGPGGDGDIYYGGGGGGWGAKGGNGGWGGNGGSGGAAVVGNSYITWINTGTRYGDIT